MNEELLQGARDALASVETAQAAASDRIHTVRCHLNEMMIKKPNAGVISQEEIDALIQADIDTLATLSTQLNGVGA